MASRAPHTIKSANKAFSFPVALFGFVNPEGTVVLAMQVS